MASDSSTSKKADKAPAATTEAKPEGEKPAQKSAALEEDDEFEDFPVDGQYTSHPPQVPSTSDSPRTRGC